MEITAPGGDRAVDHRSQIITKGLRAGRGRDGYLDVDRQGSARDGLERGPEPGCFVC